MNTLSRRSANALNRAAFLRQPIRKSHEAKPRRWARWQDVPDDWVLPSKRMPDNPYYQTETWKNIKKRQIFYSQEDGIPTWLKRGYPYNYLYWVMFPMGAWVVLSTFYDLLDGHIYPAKKKEE